MQDAEEHYRRQAHTSLDMASEQKFSWLYLHELQLPPKSRTLCEMKEDVDDNTSSQDYSA